MPAGGPSSWDPRIAQLGTQFPTAALSIVSPDGFPFAIRVPVRVDEAARWIRIEGELAGAPLQPGLACLTAHTHADQFSRQQNFQVRGDLVFVDGVWALRPCRLVGGLRAPPLAARDGSDERRQDSSLPPYCEARAGTPQLMPAGRISRTGDARKLTVAAIGPTGDIGRSLLRSLDKRGSLRWPADRSIQARKVAHDGVPPRRRARSCVRRPARRWRGRRRPPRVPDPRRSEGHPERQPRGVAQRVRCGSRSRRQAPRLCLVGGRVRLPSSLAVCQRRSSERSS
jgi:hypothetical protein